MAAMALLLGNACSNSEAYYNKENRNWEAREQPASPIEHSVFLIGDAGAPDLENGEPALKLLQSKIGAAGKNSTTIFLGDNIYTYGLPEEDEPGRPLAEKRINAQLDAVKNYPGNLFFIPGNHDWNKSHKGGWKAVKRQEDYIEEYLDRGDIFVPDGGCPGPIEVNLSDDVVLLLLDSEWWLHKWDKPVGEKGGCENMDEVAVATAIEDALARHKNKRVMVAAHHPIFSNGSHAGRYPLKTHIFPLTEAHEALYIPLPIIGSIFPFFRKYSGHIQDLAHPKNKVYTNTILDFFDDYTNLIYANGHEHNLQYFEKDSNHYIVSGSGSKTTYVARGHKSSFSHAAEGFSQVDYHTDGSVWMKFWEPDATGASGHVIYRKQLKAPGEKPMVTQNTAGNANNTEASDTTDYTDSIITVVPGDIYSAGQMQKLFMGTQYRETWLTPIEVPVLDLYKEKGGLTPLKKGGGQQTLSLRFQGEDGKQYVIRSIQKYPIKALPKALRKTIAVSIVQDMISIAHPYGAMMIPLLAEEAGIYHSNPKVVYVPDDPKLGDYREEFAGMLALFEERPSGDQSDNPSFGNSKKLIGSPDVYKKLYKDNDNYVDQQFFLRSRLFDMLIGDWDRHEDQWRWATFKSEDGKGKMFRPIPRDRDQAFVKFQGVLPSIANRKWALRKFQPFDHDVRDIAGLCFNARYIDRTFLTGLSKEEWIKMAEELKSTITDATIEKSVQSNLQEAPYELEGETIISKLKSRREKLPEFAERYYLILAKEVDVVGSDKHEYFEVKRLNDEQTEVTVYKSNDSGKKKKVIYHRIFKREETKEIRLYGMGESDIFHLSGEVKKGIKVRVIGGKGKDKITDVSKVSGWAKKTKVYDKKKKTELEKGPETKDLTRNNDPEINSYDHHAFKYDVVSPLAYFGFNVDDGLFIGAGGQQLHHGFRKDPYSFKQNLSGQYAVATGAFHIKYNSHFTELIGGWDLTNSADLRAFSYVANYFGLGNETTIPDREDLDFNRVRLSQVTLDLGLSRTSTDSRHTFSFGPTYQTTEVEQTIGRIVSDSLGDLSNSDFNRKQYGGGKMMYKYGSKDHAVLPNRGFNFLLEAGFNANMDDLDTRFGKIKSEVSFYHSLNLPLKPVLAVRVGGATNIGDFEFFQANSIGGLNEVRGMRRDRFAGRSSFYQNTELRLSLFNLQSYIVPIQVGVLGFYDIGRVWVDNDNSDKLHYGTGGGLWISPLDVVVISGVYSKSDDDDVINVTFGYLF